VSAAFEDTKESPLSWEHAIGLDVAGNFAGHLEQAGEAGDFSALPGIGATRYTDFGETSFLMRKASCSE
jgi:hypothetical protein